MINVTKKELTERTFVPYQLTITIDSELDHQNLQKEVREFRSNVYYFWERLTHRQRTLEHILTEIENHR